LIRRKETIIVDFVDWCGLVLKTCSKLGQTSSTARTIGVEEFQLGQALCEDLGIPSFRGEPEYGKSTYYRGMLDAVQNLLDAQLLEKHERASYLWKVTKSGRDYIKDQQPLWMRICQEQLEPEHQQMLQAVNRLSPRSLADHAVIEEVPYESLISELGWTTGGAIWAVANELHKWGYVRGFFAADGSVRLRATFRGLVWETRRGVTIQSKFIDELVQEWETTSVEFKEYLYLSGVEQKAEFIKDILSLANTQASGRRWMVIGFNNRTHAYTSAPDPKIRQDDLERLLSAYTDPPVEVRYEVVQYRSGPVGMLEVIRDAKKVPYRVKQSLGEKLKGDKHQIFKGQMFVRHGSQVEAPTEKEEQALIEEGARARGG
jgi:hypothetical protein